MRWKFAFAILAVAALAYGLAGCGASCSASNCTGCCDTSGVCQAPSDASCGNNGAACVACLGVQTCETILGECVFGGGTTNGGTTASTNSGTTTGTNGTTVSTSGGTTGSCDVVCNYDADCGGSETCASNCCVPTSDSCVSGSCESGTCGPGYSCNASTHCCDEAVSTTGTTGSCTVLGESCVEASQCCDGTCGSIGVCCIANGSPTTLATDCCSGFEDSTDTCRSGVTVCTYDSDCAGTQYCANGTCEGDTQNPNACEQGSCFLGGTCGPGFSCNATDACCVTASECAYSPDCGGDEYCENGSCVPNPNGYTCSEGSCAGSGCGASEDSGFMCDTLGQCCEPITSCASGISCTSSCATPGYSCESGCCVETSASCTQEYDSCALGVTTCCSGFTCQLDQFGSGEYLCE